MQITRELRDEAKAGMAEMSEKFLQEGGNIYGKVKAE
jgi:hypothetical protein